MATTKKEPLTGNGIERILSVIDSNTLTAAHKVAYTFKIFGAQRAVTYICEEYSNFQDSKSTFFISDFKLFFNNDFETAEVWCIIGLTAFSHLLQRKNPLFFNVA